MPRGGRREGAGRRKGSVSAQTKAKRALAAKAEADGITPLEVMLGTMRAIWNEATDETGKVVSVPLAMQASTVAEKAAAFIHPKLSTVQQTKPEEDEAPKAVKVTVVDASEPDADA